MEFKDRLLQSGILDPVGRHHEFASGSHGRKLDFDLLADDSELYRSWVQINTEIIQRSYHPLPSALVGVANGTNRLSRDVAAQLDLPGLVTQKAAHGAVELTQDSYQQIGLPSEKLVLILEDVGTSGKTACSAAQSVLNAGADRVEILFSWQRTNNLEFATKLQIPFNVIIKELLPTYSAERCRESGYCSAGWDFVHRTAQ